VTVFAAQWRSRRDQLGARAAEVAGAVMRRVGRSLPGTAGPLIVSVGFWMLAPWLGVVVFGAIVWALDRRV
jgi:hypothetical protein